MLDVMFEKFKFSDFNLCLATRPAIPVAEQQVITYDGIDEKDGSLTEYGPLLDRSIEMTVNYLDDIPSKQMIRRFRGALLNQRLAFMRFSDEPEIQYLVKSIKMGAIENEIAQHGEFNLTMVLDPFDYGTQVRSITGTSPLKVTNNGTYKALPVITVAGTGDIVIRTSSGQSLTIDDMIGTVVIDSEKLDYYNPSDPSRRNIKLHTKAFPELTVGENIITVQGSVTSLKVEFKERYR